MKHPIKRIFTDSQADCLLSYIRYTKKKNTKKAEKAQQTRAGETCQLSSVPSHGL